MNIGNTTPIHILIAVCFVAITGLCMAGYWFPCFYLATLVITLYMLLGSIRHGKLDLLFFCFPIATFFVTWVIGFSLAHYYAMLPVERTAEAIIFGFNPSFFWVALLYWLGGALILALGFTLLRDRWMSQADWDAFKLTMASMKDETSSGEERQ